MKLFAVQFLAAVNLASALLSASAAADSLHPFRSEDGRFSIDFPAPSPSSRNLTGDKFSVTNNDIRHAVDVDDAEFAVEIHDVPRAAYLLFPGHFILENAKSGLLGDIGAREIDSREISRQGQPGRVATFEIPDKGLTGNLLMVLAKSRLYLVTVRYPEEDEPPMPFTSFFESFEFWFE